MKKFLLLPLFFVFLLPSSALASGTNFDTEAYLDLETLVFDDLYNLRNDPVSDIDRERAFADLSLQGERAIWSVTSLADREEIRLSARAESQFLRLENRRDRALSRAKDRVDRWYRKNHSRPNARQKADRMLLRSTRQIEDRFFASAEMIDMQLNAKTEVLFLARDLQLERIERFLVLGERWIEDRPEFCEGEVCPQILSK